VRKLGLAANRVVALKTDVWQAGVAASDRMSGDPLQGIATERPETAADDFMSDRHMLWFLAF
jgi:hypothetical protein